MGEQGAEYALHDWHRREPPYVQSKHRSTSEAAEAIYRLPYLDILDCHLATPHARDFEQNFSSGIILDCSSDGIVGSAEVAFGLEIDIC